MWKKWVGYPAVAQKIFMLPFFGTLVHSAYKLLRTSGSDRHHDARIQQRMLHKFRRQTRVRWPTCPLPRIIAAAVVEQMSAHSISLAIHVAIILTSSS